MGLSTLKQRLKQKKQEMQEQMERGRTRTVELQIERRQRRQKKLLERKPGAVKAITEGLVLKKNPLEVMRDEYHRRRYERMHNKK